MVNTKDIKRDFEFVKSIKEAHSVLLFGSYAKGDFHKRSDIDICIVAPSCKAVKSKAILLSKILKNLKKPYDVRLFEEFPLYIQIEIIKNHKIIFSKDTLELSYYFYKFRKLWQEQAVARLEKTIRR